MPLQSSQMRRTLRRSCTACAKTKNKCDLQTPKCSRCIRRQISCTYANEPLNHSCGQQSATSSVSPSSSLPVAIGSNSFDPFDSYPPTSLPRSRVQNLIVHCKSGPRILAQRVANSQCSSFKDRFSVLSSGSQCPVKSIHQFLVACRYHRPCFI